MPHLCDLVMKGGITSGVIYPRLIARLAKKYQFKNIGGTSAGAIAAAGCAAAQYAALNGYPEAFDKLAQLPDELSRPNNTSDGTSTLFNLFQPSPRVRAYYNVLTRGLNLQPRPALLSMLNGMTALYATPLCIALLLGSLLLSVFVMALAPGGSVVMTLLTGLILMALVAALFAVAIHVVVTPQRGCLITGALALVIAMGGVLMLASEAHQLWPWVGSLLGVLAVGLLFQCLLLLLTIAVFARGLIKGVHGNNYGVCSGRASNESTSRLPALTDWLTTYFDALAHLPAGRGPLTFGDLWGHTDKTAPRAINLEVVTTAISQQMVYGIPFREGIGEFYYAPDEWAALFPESVMGHLDAASGGSQSPNVQSRKGVRLKQLPASAYLPIVVAVRMSLSFPLLLSAVPLYAIDRSLKRQSKGVLIAKRVWFRTAGSAAICRCICLTPCCLVIRPSPSI
jgi:hypothetical protein